MIYLFIYLSYITIYSYIRLKLFKQIYIFIVSTDTVKNI